MRAPILTFKRARSLRHKMTLPEVVLWQQLRRGRVKGLQFRRQHPIGPYILDFFCSSARLAIEIDGSSHTGVLQATHDRLRDQWLAARDIRVLRIAAAEVLRDDSLQDVLHYIEQAAAPSASLRSAPPP